MSPFVVFLHILGAAIWAGGLIFVALAAGAASRTVQERERLDFFRVLGSGFLILSGIAATLLFISGNLLVDDLFGGWGELGDSSSGKLVLWKTGLYAGVLALALVHAIGVGPKIRRLRTAALDGHGDEAQATALRRAVVVSRVSQALMLAGTIAILVLAAEMIS
jgi:putative copper export protein